MSETPINPLRARMIEDMSVRNLVTRRRTITSATLRVSQHSSAGRRPRRYPKTCAAIKCIKARPERNLPLSTAQSLRCGSSLG
jgi:hypothetical protein